MFLRTYGQQTNNTNEPKIQFVQNDGMFKSQPKITLSEVLTIELRLAIGR